MTAWQQLGPLRSLHGPSLPSPLGNASLADSDGFFFYHKKREYNYVDGGDQILDFFFLAV